MSNFEKYENLIDDIDKFLILNFNRENEEDSLNIMNDFIMQNHKDPNISTKQYDYSYKKFSLSSILDLKQSRDKGKNEDDNSATQNKREEISKEIFFLSNSKQEPKESEEIYCKIENDPNKKNNSTKCGTNEIQKIKKSERGKGKDNYSIKLFKTLNDWVCQKIKDSGIEIHKPDYNIFTHNTNLIDIYMLLDIRYKNILSMTSKDKKAFDKFKELKIKKNYKRKICPLTENSKEFRAAVGLLLKYGKIKENEKNVFEIERQLIKLLIEKKLKHPCEKDLFKNDKDNIWLILKKEGIKKSRDFQKKNKNILKDIDNNECNKTLRQLIIEFYKSEKAFEVFSEKVREINDNFKLAKKNKYSLLDIENNGFIKMVEEDCNLEQEQKRKIKNFTTYFLDKPLNEEEIQKYIENV